MPVACIFHERTVGVNQQTVAIFHRVVAGKDAVGIPLLASSVVVRCLILARGHAVDLQRSGACLLRAGRYKYLVAAEGDLHIANLEMLSVLSTSISQSENIHEDVTIERIVVTGHAVELDGDRNETYGEHTAHTLELTLVGLADERCLCGAPTIADDCRANTSAIIPLGRLIGHADTDAQTDEIIIVVIIPLNRPVKDVSLDLQRATRVVHRLLGLNLNDGLTEGVALFKDEHILQLGILSIGVCKNLPTAEATVLSGSTGHQQRVKRADGRGGVITSACLRSCHPGVTALVHCLLH